MDSNSPSSLIVEDDNIKNHNLKRKTMSLGQLGALDVCGRVVVCISVTDALSGVTATVQEPLRFRSPLPSSLPYHSLSRRLLSFKTDSGLAVLRDETGMVGVRTSMAFSNSRCRMVDVERGLVNHSWRAAQSGGHIPAS